jgi:hypothetical protein
MTAAAITTWSVSQGFAERLRPFGAGFLAKKLGTSKRTVENWLAGTATPQARHVIAMLADRELAKEVLTLAGRADLADVEKALKHIDAFADVIGEARDRADT